MKKCCYDINKSCNQLDCNAECFKENEIEQDSNFKAEVEYVNSLIDKYIGLGKRVDKI